VGYLPLFSYIHTRSRVRSMRKAFFKCQVYPFQYLLPGTSYPVPGSFYPYKVDCQMLRVQMYNFLLFFLPLSLPFSPQASDATGDVSWTAIADDPNMKLGERSHVRTNPKSEASYAREGGSPPPRDEARGRAVKGASAYGCGYTPRVSFSWRHLCL